MKQWSGSSNQRSLIGNGLDVGYKNPKHFAQDYSTKEIAAKLGLSIATIDTHRTNLKRKLGLHSVAELVRYAIEHGLIEL